jgi:arylsulfatase A-like enzyme
MHERRARGRTAAVVACLLAALVVAGRHAPPVRLPAWRELPTGDPSALLPGLELRKLRVGHDTRNAVEAIPGEPLRLSLLPAPQHALEVAFALSCAPAARCRGATVFRVRALSAPGRPALLERTLAAPSDGWSVERVDLARFAGRRLELGFETETQGGALARLAGARARAVWGEPLLQPAAGAGRPHVLLVSLDTLRADRVGAWGYPRPTTPNLDALAAAGVRFAEAISQAPWTTPSHMSLLSALYPSAHGLNRGFQELQSSRRGQGAYPTLPDGVPTLASLLRDAGWRTLAHTGGTTLAAELGFHRGFDVYRDGFPALDDAVLAQLEAWLDVYAAREPVFLFFHTFEPHAPYTHSELAEHLLDAEQHAALAEISRTGVRRGTEDRVEPFLRTQGLMRPEVTSALYDGDVRASDAFLGRLFAALARRGLWERTLVVVLSDHGEEFAEHRSDRFYNAHCATLHRELVHVPLLMRVPGRFAPGRVVEGPVELVDVAPTLLELLGLPVPAGLHGESLVARMDGAPAPPDATALSEATCAGDEWKALRIGAHKYLAGFSAPGGERSGIPGARRWERLYDVERDPGERHNLATGTGGWPERLRAHFEPLARGAGGAQHELDDATRERLRAMGYLDERTAAR